MFENLKAVNEVQVLNADSPKEIVLELIVMVTILELLKAFLLIVVILLGNEIFPLLVMTPAPWNVPSPIVVRFVVNASKLKFVRAVHPLNALLPSLVISTSVPVTVVKLVQPLNTLDPNSLLEPLEDNLDGKVTDVKDLQLENAPSLITTLQFAFVGHVIVVILDELKAFFSIVNVPVTLLKSRVVRLEQLAKADSPTVKELLGAIKLVRVGLFLNASFPTFE